MPKVPRNADRILFLGVCCLIGIFSIGFWLSGFFGFQRPTTASPQPVAEIPLNQTIRAVWNSGLYKDVTAAGGIYWLDNDTIVVSANSGSKPVTSEQRHVATTSLYLWRLDEKPLPYGADPRAAAVSYCAAHGEISYQVDTLDPQTGASIRTRWLGPPGREREVARRKVHSEGQARIFPSIEPIDCETYSDPAMVGKFYTADSERRFYLDFGDDPLLAAVNVKPAQPIVLMRADGSERIPLPISNALIDPGSTHFHTFDKTFYLWNGSLVASPINHFAIWRDTKCWPIWRVDPRSAKVDHVCIPFGPWSGINGAASLALAPTKEGLFFSSRSINAKDESGFYRIDNGTASRILPSHALNPVVSPNGCRIAFNHIPSIDAYSAYSPISSSIVAIDVCSSAPSATNSPK